MVKVSSFTGMARERVPTVIMELGYTIAIPRQQEKSWLPYNRSYSVGMARAKPIPVKLSDEIIARLDRVSLATGLNNRSAVIKFCISTFLDHIERSGRAGLPADWKEILRDMDGRTYRYRPQRMIAAEGSEQDNAPAKRAGKRKGGAA